MPKQPTRADWSELYEAAAAFRALAPWRWTRNDDLFALEPSAYGETAFCSVHGDGGEDSGLAVFVGADGYQGLKRLVAGDGAPKFSGQVRAFRSLSVTYVDRQALQDEDRQVIRALGLRFRGRGMWPLFRSQSPQHLPWFLDQREARLLSTALRQAVTVATKTREGSRRRRRHSSGLILTRYFSRGRWQEDWREPPVATPAEACGPVDDFRLFRLKERHPWRDGVWEIGCFVVPSPTTSASGPPYFPTCVLAASQASGVVGTRLIGPIPSIQDKQLAILSILEESPILPQQVLVPEETMLRLLRPMAQGLGMPARLALSVPALEGVVAGLVQGLLAPDGLDRLPDPTPGRTPSSLHVV